MEYIQLSALERGEQRGERARGELRHHFGIRSVTSKEDGYILRIAPRVALINKN